MISRELLPAAMGELIHQFVRIGLSEKKAAETAKNASLSSNLAALIGEARRHSPDCDLASVGSLLYNCAARIKSQLIHHLPLLAAYITDGRIDSEARLSAALDYLLTNPTPPVNTAQFESNCGVGVIVSHEEIRACVSQVLIDHGEELRCQRYCTPVGPLLQKLRSQLRWADGRQLKAEFDSQLLKLLGPRTAADNTAAAATRKQQPRVNNKASQKTNAVPGSAVPASHASVAEDGASTMCELMAKLSFHAPGENYTTDGYVLTDNTMQHMRNHLAVTGGKVRTRFPPEPNGILHIGHAKAININFGYAAAHSGVCYLRYDDTNPEKEEEKFFVGIRDMVQWLGYTPHAITHSSDHFQLLFETAQKLIAGGHAYVCHQTVEQMRGQNVEPSPWRQRPADENMRLFNDMRCGKFEEGGATLRLKLTLEEGKVDPVAYRIKYVPHHRTGSDWCIYPTYDYTHCLCDSFEHISHSLCTKEFQSRRSSYYWLCNAADVYCPVQWEYGRLNITYTVVSKRKIGRLIAAGIVADWDDPRLFTLTALRRRGLPAAAINNFCARLGVTGAQMAVEPAMLDAVVRDCLNVSAPRRMAVLQPLRVRIVDLPPPSTGEGSGLVRRVMVPDFPGRGSDSGQHSISLSSIVYIERSDYRHTAPADFRRLTAEQPVGLRHTGFSIRLISEQLSADGSLEELVVACESLDAGGKAAKPRAFVHWVSEPKSCTVRLYEQLFHHKNPEDPVEVPGGFLSDVNRDSLTEVSALIDQNTKAAVYDKFQFERLGFFSVDPDSSDERLVFNRTVTLKEDMAKD